MKEYTFRVTYKVPVYNGNKVDAIDAVLEGKKPIRKEIYEVKASRMWTALQRLGYQLWNGTYKDDCFSNIRLVSVKEIPKVVCKTCKRKYTASPFLDQGLCRKCTLITERLKL